MLIAEPLALGMTHIRIVEANVDRTPAYFVRKFQNGKTKLKRIPETRFPEGSEYMNLVVIQENYRTSIELGARS